MPVDYEKELNVIIEKVVELLNLALTQKDYCGAERVWSALQMLISLSLASIHPSIAGAGLADIGSDIGSKEAKIA